MKAERNFTLANLNVLVAEDEHYNFLFISEALRDYNINVIRAHNGKMAVQFCSENQDIDLVLMDVSMPVMDGLEATRKIKSFRPDLPIIIQTAYSSSSDKANALECGCDDFLTKPFSKVNLLKCIETYKPATVCFEKA